jgi:hypothetical protein
MTPDEKLKRFQGLLLEDVLSGKLRWFYISMAGPKGFIGGVFIEARGPTEAWRLLHGLGLYPPGSGAETQTYEVPAEKVAYVTADRTYRRLSKADLEKMDEMHLQHPDAQCASPTTSTSSGSTTAGTASPPTSPKGG